MKIAVAQFRSTSGALSSNLKRHSEFAVNAASAGAKIIFFPELSLTNYEPKLA